MIVPLILKLLFLIFIAPATKNFRVNSISERYEGYSRIPQLGEEPHAEVIQNPRGNISGGSEYHKPNSYSRRPMYSQTLSLTGGIDYTYGIEHESVCGVLPNSVCADYGLTKVGDGSTRFRHIQQRRHYEYVTSVLHGDMGIRRMYKYLPLIGKHTIPNENCSTHIHIGGQKDQDRGLSTDSPVFNRKFSGLAIRLGTQVEDSLNALMPEYRDIHAGPLPGRDFNYCSSISRWKNWKLNSKEDYDRLIASFVFNKSKLDRSSNKKTMLGKWNHSRYKWLNLINCNSTNGRYRSDSFSTIEFRIFPPTNNPELCHFYVLICLAFVWFVENRERAILERDDITIQYVLREAYEGKKVYDSIISKYI
jgi:hypothetical protein